MWRFAWLVVVPACTIAFGLDEPRDDDRDHDGIPDSRDNCPDKPNVDQSDHDGNGIGDACDGCNATSSQDSDGDGIPDACDGCDNRLPDTNGDGVPDACESGQGGNCPNCLPCAIGPLHDEDGDLLSDACDPCPAIAGDAADADHDGVGDLCDFEPQSSNEQIFDAFYRPNATWFEQGAWTAAADAVVTNVSLDVAYRQLGSAGAKFSVATHATGMAGSTPVTFGVYAAAQQEPPGTADDDAECLVNLDNLGHATVGTYTRQAGTPDMDVTLVVGITSDYTITLVAHDSTVKCVFETAGVTIINSVTLPVTLTLQEWLPGIEASGAGSARFDYFDVVTDVH